MVCTLKLWPTLTHLAVQPRAALACSYSWEQRRLRWRLLRLRPQASARDRQVHHRNHWFWSILGLRLGQIVKSRVCQRASTCTSTEGWYLVNRSHKHRHCVDQYRKNWICIYKFNMCNIATRWFISNCLKLKHSKHSPKSPSKLHKLFASHRFCQGQPWPQWPCPMATPPPRRGYRRRMNLMPTWCLTCRLAAVNAETGG